MDSFQHEGQQSFSIDVVIVIKRCGTGATATCIAPSEKETYHWPVILFVLTK